MDGVTILGLAAGTLTTIAFLPQVIRTWRLKSARDLSLGMVLIFSAGVLLWLVYGLLTQDLPVILANLVTLVLNLTILIFKLKFG